MLFAKVQKIFCNIDCESTIMLCQDHYTIAISRNTFVNDKMLHTNVKKLGQIVQITVSNGTLPCFWSGKVYSNLNVLYDCNGTKDIKKKVF